MSEKTKAPKKTKATKTITLPEDLQSIRWLNEYEVAGLTGLAVQTLRNSRFRGVGIRYVKLNRSVRYALRDVLSYMESHRISTREV